MPTMTRAYRWYVLVTRCNHEAKAEKYLRSKNIEVYLPTYQTLKQWTGRKKWITSPLFPSYLFVRVSIREYSQALMDSSIVRYITLEDQPCPVPDDQIEAIKAVLTNKIPFEVTDEAFKPGKKVVIQSGPLMGYQAEIIERRGKERLVLCVEGTEKKIIIDEKDAGYLSGESECKGGASEVD